MSSLDRLLAKVKRALTYGAVGLASLIPLKEVNGQDTDKYLNPFVQPNQTALYYGSGDVDEDGDVDWDDYHAMDSVQNDMADVDGDGVASTAQDKATLESHLRDNILLPSDWESQTREGRDNWIKKVALIDSTNYIPLNSPEWKCTEYSIQFGIVNCRGYFNADLPPKYDNKYNRRFNDPGYCVSISSENILGGGHDMNGFLTGDSALTFNDWNFIEPQTDSTNVRPEQGSWNMPYNSEMWIYGIRKFRDNTLHPIPIVGFNIDENGNDSLIYQYPNELVLTRTPQDTIPPKIAITHPKQDSTYTSYVTELRYNLFDENPSDSSEYSLDNGLTRVSVPWSSDTTITGLRSRQGENTWIKYARDLFGNGSTDIVRFNVDTTTNAIDLDNIVLPSAYSLKQNYPNPFNPSTKISYSIPKEGPVSLKVYDIRGKELKTLVNQRQTPGYYEVDFKAEYLPSGVYFYQLKAGDFAGVGRMLYLK